MGFIGEIAKFVWGLFGSTLVDLALTAGLPAVFEFLKAKGFPQFLINLLMAMAKALLGEIPTVVAKAHTDIKAVKADDSLSPEEKKVQIKSITRNVKREYRRKCSGAGCVSETKALD